MSFKLLRELLRALPLFKVILILFFLTDAQFIEAKPLLEKNQDSLMLPLTTLNSLKLPSTDDLSMKVNKPQLDWLLIQALNRKCRLYHSSPQRWKAEECQKYAQQMVHYLDFVPSSDWAVAAFSHQLLTLVNNPQLENYLQTLSEQIESYDPNFNLWDFNLRYWGQNKEIALMFIAVLTQDNNMLTHIHFLRKKKANPVNLALLTRINKALNYLYPEQLYPHSVKIYSSKLYHFYVIAYLTKMLQKFPPTSAHPNASAMSLAIPAIFNTLYENIHLEFRPWADPRHLDLDKTEHITAMHDTYVGILGAWWAYSDMPNNENWNQDKDLDWFINIYAPSPFKFMNSLMHWCWNLSAP